MDLQFANLLSVSDILGLLGRWRGGRGLSIRRIPAETARFRSLFLFEA